MLQAATRRAALGAAAPKATTTALLRFASSAPPPDSDATDALASSLAPLAAASPASPSTPRILADQTSPFDFLRDLVRSLRAKAAVALTRTHIEADFSEADFLEGAKDAYYMVTSAVSTIDGDWRAVRRATAPSLAAGLRGVRDAYTRAGLAFSLAVDSNAPISAAIDDMSLLSPAAMQVVSGESAADPNPNPNAAPSTPSSTSSTPSLAGMHQVLAVRFSGASVNILVRNAAGALVSELVDRRPKVWRFVRPLPGELPVRRLDASWTLLGID